LNDKTRLELENVKFNKSRFRRYQGNIGEMVAEEVLLREGFEVWVCTPYFPDVSPMSGKKLTRGGLVRYLSLSSTADENSIFEWGKDEREKAIKELKTFFGDKLEAFQKYFEEIAAIGYTPDLIAKKNDKIYVVEVKTNKATRYLKGEKLRGLMLARNYGFIPMLITLNINIEATNLILREL